MRLTESTHLDSHFSAQNRRNHLKLNAVFHSFPETRSMQKQEMGHTEQHLGTTWTAHYTADSSPVIHRIFCFKSLSAALFEPTIAPENGLIIWLTMACEPMIGIRAGLPIDVKQLSMEPSVIWATLPVDLLSMNPATASRREEGLRGSCRRRSWSLGSPMVGPRWFCLAGSCDRIPCRPDSVIVFQAFSNIDWRYFPCASILSSRWCSTCKEKMKKLLGTWEFNDRRAQVTDDDDDDDYDGCDDDDDVWNNPVSVGNNVFVGISGKFHIVWYLKYGWKLVNMSGNSNKATFRRFFFKKP